MEALGNMRPKRQHTNSSVAIGDHLVDRCRDRAPTGEGSAGGKSRVAV
jgi:hypothetical protein